MKLEISLLSIGFHKGEPDFRASALVKDMTLVQMNEFRAMMPVAIAAIERIWLEGQAGDALQIATQAKIIDLPSKE